MKILFDTYEEFRQFAMDGTTCPESLGFKNMCDGKGGVGECIICWYNCGADLDIKENPTKKITLQFEMPMCPYWNPITKTARHTCGSCHCESEGNTVGNAAYGVMADGDRYCCFSDDVDIRAGIVEAVKED